MQSTEATRAHAQEILDFIHANPEKHDQDVYLSGDDGNGCGTAMCIAGTSAWLKLGYREANLVIANDEVDQFASEALGLNHWEAQILFHEYRNERAVQKLKKIVVGEDFTREDFYTSYSYDVDPEDNEYAWDSHVKHEGLDNAEVID